MIVAAFGCLLSTWMDQRADEVHRGVMMAMETGLAVLWYRMPGATQYLGQWNRAERASR